MAQINQSLHSNTKIMVICNKFVEEGIMKKIVLISCAKTKLKTPANAKEFYISPLFKANLGYAYSLQPDNIFILSAQYGLVELDQILEPYDLTLNTMNVAEKKAWAEKVLTSLQKKTDTKNDHFIFLAGNNYRKYLIPELSHYEIPFEGFAFGRQLQELNRRLA